MKPLLRIFVCFVLSYSNFLLAQESLQSAGAHPEIACQFQTTTHFKVGGQPDGEYLWRMWRSSREVEVYQLGTKDGEAWILDGAGGVMYSRILHPERSEVIFNAMELRILGRPSNWSRCISLVSRDLLSEALKESGSQVYLGKEVKEFKGRLGSQMWTVLWNEEDKIAVSIEIETESQISKTLLQERHELKAQPWERLRTRGYEQIGYTELGDNDTEPRMKRIMSRMGIRCLHNGCSVVCLSPDGSKK